MFSYNKKVRLKPYEVLPLSDFHVDPDAPPLRMRARPGKMFASHSRADLAHDFNSRNEMVAPMNLRRPKSAMELSDASARDFESRDFRYVADGAHDEIAESSKELIECLPKMTAVKPEKKEESKDSLPLDTPATATRDCMMVFPQNTVPMAKYRRKISGELPDSDDDEAPMTDAQRWSKEKTLESEYNPGKNSRRKRKPSLWADPDPDGKKAYDLNDQIQKPTYMGEESMEGETISTLINKGSRRKSFAAIGTMVAKLKKRRQSAGYEEKDADEFSIVEPKKPTVVKFNIPDDEGDKASCVSNEHTPTEDLSKVDLTLPPAQFMDTSTMISYSETLVHRIVNDRRTPENVLSFPAPAPVITPAPVFSLSAIPEHDRAETVTPKNANAPVFIRPPGSPFDKSDDAISDDDLSSGRRSRHHKRQRSRGYSQNSGSTVDMNDAESERERRKRREAKRLHSSNRESERARVQKRKSSRKSRRRGSDVREKVRLDRLDRAKSERRDSRESTEEESFFKFASFLKGGDAKSPGLSKSESFAIENIARKLINLVQQTGDTNAEGGTDSDVALIGKDTATPVPHQAQSNYNTNMIDNVDSTPLIQNTVQSDAQSVSTNSNWPQNQNFNTPSRQPSITANPAYPTSSLVTVVKPDDLLSVADIFEPRDGATLKTVVRLPTLQPREGENEAALRSRVEDFLNGKTEEGDSHFQQVPGRRWVAEWARREEVIGKGAERAESKKIKRKRSSITRKRSIKRSPSTNSIGTFFSKLFGKLRIDEDTSEHRNTEVVACVYAVNENDITRRNDVTIPATTQPVVTPVADTSTNVNARGNASTQQPMMNRSVSKVTFLDEIARSKDSGVLSDMGLESVDEYGRSQIKSGGPTRPWAAGTGQRYGLR